MIARVAHLPVSALAAILAGLLIVSAVILQLTGNDAAQAWRTLGVVIGAALGLPVDPTARLGATRAHRAADPPAPGEPTAPERRIPAP